MMKPSHLKAMLQAFYAILLLRLWKIFYRIMPPNSSNTSNTWFYLIGLAILTASFIGGVREDKEALIIFTGVNIIGWIFFLSGSIEYLPIVLFPAIISISLMVGLVIIWSFMCYIIWTKMVEKI